MKSCFASVPLPGLLVALLCGLTVPGWGQVRPPGLLGQQSRLSYQALVPVADVSQAELVLRARAWAQRVAPAGKLPVLMRVTDGEVMRTTGVAPFTYDWGGKTLLPCVMRYTATITVRQGNYHYQVSDFVFLEKTTGPDSISVTPAETYFNGNFKPYREIAARFQTTMRTCFTEITGEVLAHLQESMRLPTPKTGTE
ncbi:hypothetical protein I2I05_17475 [Hymenobacter sp. BT683]|uniref:DUF4468 domain-containing protein n=1 Tax=Hymenobacter jeongseonensis TaxID=2791027 RepID=A0ABS0ILF9_9BACT|nr:hypothetical protein [Hymenobacter jeongseonensis]MBF9239199.1 hypothetical protein [Hymenobacter jeongseonensis]